MSIGHQILIFQDNTVALKYQNLITHWYSVISQKRILRDIAVKTAKHANLLKF